MTLLGETVDAGTIPLSEWCTRLTDVGELACRYDATDLTGDAASKIGDISEIAGSLSNTDSGKDAETGTERGVAAFTDEWMFTTLL